MSSCFRSAIAALSLIGLAGCTTYSALPEATDFEGARPIVGYEGRTVQVFLDKYGSLYTDFSQPGYENLIANSDEALTCQYASSLCWGLVDYTPGSQSMTDLDAWFDMQTAEAWRTAADISDLMVDGTNKDLVILIHGMRVDDASRTYGDVKERLMEGRAESEAPVFLEVHWDGQTSAFFSAGGAFLNAQWTAPQVGFRLREVLVALKELRPDVAQTNAVFVLTHSTGAAVAGSLFGDPRGALEDLRSGKAARANGFGYDALHTHGGDLEGRYSVADWPNMNIVMLAAATPASIFAYEGQPDWGFKGARSSDLFISLNTRDYALTRGGAGPTLFGASTLGALETEIERVERLLVPERAASVTLLDTTEFMARGHDFSRYLKAPDFQLAVDALWAPVD